MFPQRDYATVVEVRRRSSSRLCAAHTKPSVTERERGESHFVPYGQFDEDLSERALERLAQSMVEIIRAHNPKG